LLATVLVLANGLGTAAAEEEAGGAPKSIFDKNFTLILGGFFPAIESTFSLGSSSGGSGGDISGEDDLGLGGQEGSLYAGFVWRFARRHQLQLEWFQLNRDGTTSATTDLTIGDTDIFVGAALSSKMDLNLGRLTYGYSILRDENFDLSFLVGAHVATTKATVTATGLISVNGAPPMVGTQTESTSTITLPLPHLGGQISYKFSPRWAAQFTVLAFALKIDEYSGSLLEVDGTVAYQLTKNFGIGTGIKFFNLNLQADTSRASAEFNYQFLGPVIFGYASF
jgi:hypothetical protein